MELSLHLSFNLRRSLGSYTVGTTIGLPIEFVEVPTIPYDYLFYPPSSD
jgi:hypothetical protein